MKKPETYKTNHPTIKEISIGDKFVCYNGEIVTFVEYDKNDNNFPFRTNLGWYSKSLLYNILHGKGYNIKQRYITLKDKIDLI